MNFSWHPPLLQRIFQRQLPSHWAVCLERKYLWFQFHSQDPTRHHITWLLGWSERIEFNTFGCGFAEKHQEKPEIVARRFFPCSKALHTAIQVYHWERYPIIRYSQGNTVQPVLSQLFSCIQLTLPWHFWVVLPQRPGSCRQPWWESVRSFLTLSRSNTSKIQLGWSYQKVQVPWNCSW